MSWQQFCALVREVGDAGNDEATFKPEMSHQIFGEKYIILCNNLQFLFQILILSEI